MSDRKKARRPLFRRLQSGLEEGIRHTKGETTLRTTVLSESFQLSLSGGLEIPQEADSPGTAVARPVSGYREILWIAIIQYGTVGAGCVWGWIFAHARYFLPPELAAHVHWTSAFWPWMGISGPLLLVAEGLRFAILTRQDSRNRLIPWACGALACIAAFILFVEQFLWLGGGSEDVFFGGILPLVPFLLAVGPLIRSRAFLGLVGIILFMMASLAMIVSNGFSLYGGVGFFSSWIY